MVLSHRVCGNYCSNPRKLIYGFALNPTPSTIVHNDTITEQGLILSHPPAEASQFLFLFSHSVLSDSLQSHGLQHTRLPCPSLSPKVRSNSCPLSRWCHPTISSSVTPLLLLPSIFPASESFPVSWHFASGGQSIGTSASASVLPMNIQDWFPLGWTGLSFLQSKGLSRVLSNPTVQKHQFFSTQPSSWPNSYIHPWLLEKP